MKYLVILLLVALLFAQESLVHHYSVRTDDVPVFITSWLTNAGNSLTVRIHGNFACSTRPLVTIANQALLGTCTRSKQSTEAVYSSLSPLLSGETQLSVVFQEYRAGLVYEVNVDEYGKPYTVLGYRHGND